MAINPNQESTYMSGLYSRPHSFTGLPEGPLATSALLGSDEERQAKVTDQALNVANRSMAGTAAKGAEWQFTQAQEAWDLKKKQAEQSGQLAAQFLAQWSTGMEDVKGVFGQAFSALTGIADTLKGGGTGGSSNPLYEIANQIRSEYDAYRSTMGGAESDFLGMAKEEGLARKEAVGAIQEGMKADYGGVAGRAAADVRAQSDAQLEAETRKMMSMGVDPSSGRFGALTKRGALDTARNTAIAMNVARRGEKQRVTDLGVKAASVLDPSKTAGTAIAIRKGGTDILGQQAAVAGKAADVDISKTQAIGNTAATTGQLASAYGQAVTQPMGEMAGYMMGRAGAI